MPSGLAHIAITVAWATLLPLVPALRAQTIPDGHTSAENWNARGRLTASPDSTRYFQPLENKPEISFSPLRLTAIKGRISPDAPGNASWEDGLSAGTAGIPQPPQGPGCTAVCPVSPDASEPPGGADSRLSDQHTAALVLGTMGAALGAMLVNSIGRAPTWHAAKVLPDLRTGPTGGLYVGLHLGVQLW